MSVSLIAGYMIALRVFASSDALVAGANGHPGDVSFLLDNSHIVKIKVSIFANCITGELHYVDVSGTSLEKGVRVNRKEAVFHSDLEVVMIPNMDSRPASMADLDKIRSTSPLLDDPYMDALIGVVWALQSFCAIMGNTRFLAYGV